MFTETFHEVLKKEGVVSIVSCADNEAHVVNTWNSYIVKCDDGRLLMPAWAMRKTEKKVDVNNTILMTVGSKEVQGRMGMGTGFLITGTARFISSGPEYDMMKEKYSFLTRVLEVTVDNIKQTV